MLRDLAATNRSLAMCNSDLVSVIIPSRNRIKKLHGAVKSVLDQTWPNIEIIIVDDDSKETIKNVFKNNTKQIPIKIIRNQKKIGGAESRNEGIRHASGKFIAFLDDDDKWQKEKITKQIFKIKESTNNVAVSCWFYIQKNKRLRLKKIYSNSDLQNILLKNFLGGASMLLTTKKNLETVGLFNSKLPSMQDWDLWIKLFLLGDIPICKEPLVTYNDNSFNRITTNIDYVYQGRRKVYFQFKKIMTIKTRKNNLGQLVYLRPQRTIDNKKDQKIKIYSQLGFWNIIYFFLKNIKLYISKTYLDKKKT